MSSISRNLVYSGLMAMLLVAAVSCSGASSEEPSRERQTDGEAVLRIHWRGTKAIITDTNSGSLMKIMMLPESNDLRVHTLNKLAMAPWVLQGGNVDTNASNLLTPLLHDIYRNECFLELSAPNGSAPTWTLACRTGEETSTLWETNLAAMVESLGGQRPAPVQGRLQGWTISDPKLSNAVDTNRNDWTIDFIRSGSWAILRFNKAGQTFDPLAENAWGETAPDFDSPDSWMEVTADVHRLAALFSLTDNWLGGYPSVNLRVAGDADKVRAVATLEFPELIDLAPTPWNVPTNYIQPPLSSFTAVRGIDHLLQSSTTWQKFGFKETPEQIFVWADSGRPMFTYFAACMTDPESFVSQASRLILNGDQPWKDEDGMMGFKWAPDHNGVEWQGLPYLDPFLKSTKANGESYVMGGSFHQPILENPLPPNYYESALSSSNLVYYDWEHTGERLAQWLYIGQFIRFVSGRPQLPFESSSVRWIKTMQSQLEDSVTRINQESPHRLMLTRTSSLGFTAIELHLMLDWLESPEFPLELNSFAAQSPPVPH